MLPFVGRESIPSRGTPASDQSTAETAEEITSRAIRCSRFARDINDRDGSWVSDHVRLAHHLTMGQGIEGLEDDLESRVFRLSGASSLNQK